MTKRAYPFEPNFCRQSKIHLSNYENDLAALKEIEALTVEKIMNASRNFNSCSSNNTQSLDSNFGSEDNNKNLIQKCVTNYFTVNGKTIKETMNKMKGLPELGSRCSFCDHVARTFQCINCQDFFCETCSLAKYDSFEDSRICLSCS